VGRVTVPKPLGNEKVDRGSEQLVPGVPEHSLGLGVDQGDPTRLVD
jgi:hypothetical protein